jgi:acetoin utilization deacetylase AcuC-like enzyme
MDPLVLGQLHPRKNHLQDISQSGDTILLVKIISSNRHRLHATSASVPGCAFRFAEVPERAEQILASLQAVYPDSIVPPTEHGMTPLLKIHTEEYLYFLQNSYHLRQKFINDGLPVVAEVFPHRRAHRRPTTYPGIAGWFVYDNAAPILAGTWDAAYAAAQCALTAADFAREGVPITYALCRPPGHHAATDVAGGYCYLNNAAIAARHLQLGTNTHIAIVDIDYHHGNGTQEIFYRDPSVLYVSLHADTTWEYPFFWGGEEEVGDGDGFGANLNLPLPDATDNVGYLAALDRALERVQVFAPAYLVLSVGFDLMQGDPEVLGLGFAISPEGLFAIGQRLAALRLPTVIVQEGGYNIERLGDYAVTFLSAF